MQENNLLCLGNLLLVNGYLHFRNFFFTLYVIILINAEKVEIHCQRDFHKGFGVYPRFFENIVHIFPSIVQLFCQPSNTSSLRNKRFVYDFANMDFLGLLHKKRGLL